MTHFTQPTLLDLVASLASIPLKRTTRAAATDFKQTDGPFTVPANPGGSNLGLPLPVTTDSGDTPNDFCGRLFFNYG